MHGVHGTQVEQHSPLYVRLTRVHQATLVEQVTAARAVPLQVVLQAEVGSDEGTPAWRAWVARAAARHGITGCPDTIEELVP